MHPRPVEDAVTTVNRIVRSHERIRTVVIFLGMVIVMAIAIGSAWRNLVVTQSVVAQQEQNEELMDNTLDAVADWAVQTYQVLDEFRKTTPKGQYLKIPTPPPLLQGGEWLPKDALVKSSPPPTAKAVREHHRKRPPKQEPFNLFKWLFTPRTTH